MDTIRVLRVIEYSGPRDAVEEQLKKSVHGQREGVISLTTGEPCIIRVATIGLVPDIIEMGRVEKLLPTI